MVKMAIRYGRRGLRPVLIVGPAAALVAFILLAFATSSAGAPHRPAAQLGNFPDQYEVNDTYTQSKLLAGQVVVSLTFYVSGTGNSNDQDWYSLFIGNNQILNLTAAAQQSAPLFARGFLTNGHTSAGTYTDNNNISTVTITNTSGNTQEYLIRVTNGSSQNLVYQITYAFAPIPPPPPTNTPLPGLVPDTYEPNDTIAEALLTTTVRGPVASFIAAGNSIQNLSFTPFNDGRPADTADWFSFYGRAGSIYQINTSNVQPGVETVLAVYQFDGATLLPGILGSTNPNNRYIAGQRGSQVIVQIPADGTYWIRVTNLDSSPRVPGQTYALSAVEILQATATPGPTATAFPANPDAFEYNGWFDTATLIAPNTDYRNLNFVPWNPPTPNTQDNDFFRLPVKQGVYYSCYTFELSPGTDTNIIAYNQDQVALGGNDDADPSGKLRGDFSSRFTWLSGYTGYAYILVGEVNPPRANEGQTRTYALRCDIGLPPTPTPTVDPRGTPTPLPTFVPPTPEPPEPTMTPFPTPRTAQNLPIRPIDARQPTPTVQPTPQPRRVVVSVQIHTEVNRNNAPDPGEGIANISVRLSDEASGLPLAQAVTDADGRAGLVVFNNGAVRLTVPLFGYSTVITTDTASVRIAVISSPDLPKRLP
ncbi:MAG: hypothetical protein RMN25_09140 [Anaerolineae bacterium]|nr:hypothetical protein [Thermoflexales bacterium]MDW8407933.1 hypothetical protein [Anaerolineae bacterium]